MQSRRPRRSRPPWRGAVAAFQAPLLTFGEPKEAPGLAGEDAATGVGSCGHSCCSGSACGSTLGGCSKVQEKGTGRSGTQPHLGNGTCAQNQMQPSMPRQLQPATRPSARSDTRVRTNAYTQILTRTKIHRHARIHIIRIHAIWCGHMRATARSPALQTTQQPARSSDAWRCMRF